LALTSLCSCGFSAPEGWDPIWSEVGRVLPSSASGRRGTMNRGIIGTIIGVLVIIVLVLVITRMM
jgi:hypothetical protein